MGHANVRPSPRFEYCLVELEDRVRGVEGKKYIHEFNHVFFAFPLTRCRQTKLTTIDRNLETLKPYLNLMPTLKFFYVFIVPMPSEDKLQPDHTTIQVGIAKHIGAETCADTQVVIYLII